LLADPAKADDADRLPEDLVARLALPLALAAGVDAVEDVLLEGEQEEEGVLGDRRVVHPGGEEDGDLLGGRVLDVDLVDADPVLADDLQPGEGLVDPGLGDG